MPGDGPRGGKSSIAVKTSTNAVADRICPRRAQLALKLDKTRSGNAEIDFGTKMPARAAMIHGAGE